MSLTSYRSSLYHDISEQVKLLVEDAQALNSVHALSALSTLVASALELLLEERQAGAAGDTIDNFNAAQTAIVKRYRQLNAQVQGAPDGQTS